MKRAEHANITSLRMENAKGLLTISISGGERIMDANEIYQKNVCLNTSSEMTCEEHIEM